MPGQKLARELPFGGKGGDPKGAKLEGKLAGIGKRNPATAIGIGGVLVVVVVAMARRGKGGGGASSDQAQQYGTGTYDSTANDLYNSIEGQIEALDRKIGDITKTPAPKPPTHKPKPKPKPKHPPKHHKPPKKHGHR